MKELDDLITILEATIPANPASPQNIKLANELEAELKKYFKQVEDMMPTEKLEQIYYKAIGEMPPPTVESRSPEAAQAIPLVEVSEPVVIQGPPGKDGYTPVKGVDYFDGKDGRDGRDGKDGIGKDGKDAIDGKDGYAPVKGVDYFDGTPGKDGADGVSIKGEKGDTGDPGLSKKQQDSIKKLITEFSGKKFIEDDDPRLKDERKSLPHKHDAVIPMIYSPTIGGDGVLSDPPSGKYKVKNLYVEPDTGKLTIEYEYP